MAQSTGVRYPLAEFTRIGWKIKRFGLTTEFDAIDHSCHEIDSVKQKIHSKNLRHYTATVSLQTSQQFGKDLGTALQVIE